MTKIIISGGGTGGHIFPAIAIANALRLKEPKADILFIGARGRLEMEKVPAAGYPIEGLTISGFVRRLTWKNLTFPFKLAGSLLRARSIISRFAPDVVVGVGGYASGPTLRMAVSMGIPALIQEQNSFPGVTNRLLAAKVQSICVAYPGMDRYFPREKLMVTGNPVRQDLLNLEGMRSEALSHFAMDKGRNTLLVMGGSGGAGTINEAVRCSIEAGLDQMNLQILWQTGKHYFEEVKRQIDANAHPHVHILPFIDRMDLAYAAADLVVSRSGALAISELCVAGKPVVLIPSPNVAEDHQRKNAEALVKRDAAVLVTDQEAKSKLFDTLQSLLTSANNLEMLSKNIKSLAITNAADLIAAEVLRLAGERRPT